MNMYPVTEPIKTNALDALALDIRLHGAGYTRQVFTAKAEQAVQSYMNFTSAQAVCIISSAMERRSDWTAAHDWGNLLEEISWYCMLYASLARNAGRG